MLYCTEIVSYNGLDGIRAVAGLNDASPCGDMMYLLRKYDVARFTRNEAMFAKNVAKPHIIRRKPTSLATPISFVEGKHH